MKEIPLTKGKFALCDDDDYPILIKLKWSYNERKGYGGYAVTTMNGERISMHTLVAIWEYGTIQPGYEVDHCGPGTEKTLDNRRSSIRLATVEQNRQHRGVSRNKRTSRFKGVYFRPRLKNKPWEVVIQANGKRHYVGYFATEIEAAMRYNEKAIELHGKFAYPNDLSA